jgi:hypothetical protein
VIDITLNMARNKARSNKADSHKKDLRNQFEREHTPIKLLVSTNNKFDINTAYSWTSARELKLQTSTDQFRDMFRQCIPENTLPMRPGVFGAYEIALPRLQPWYDDLSFKNQVHTSTLLKKQMKKYYYKVVFFFPNINKEEKSTEIPKLNQEHILRKLSVFYKSIFNMNAADVHSIDTAISQHPSILILAIFTNKTGEASKLAHPPVDLDDRIEVVGAMTYVLSQMDPSGVLKVPPCAMILWFATSRSQKAKNYKDNPTKNLNWSGSGFGLFLLILLTKRCAVQTLTTDDDEHPLPSLKIFAQCNPSAKDKVYKYYERWGFKCLNHDLENNGRDDIPLTLLNQLRDGTFINFEESQMYLFCLESSASTLEKKKQEQEQEIVFLESSTLEKKKQEQEQEIDLKYKVWAGFPPSLAAGKDLIILSHDDYVEIQTNLEYLNRIFPFSNRHRFLDLSEQFFGGYVDMDSRIAESKANGTKWMSHGHISAALALFMSDGRYKDHVAIIPPNHMASIKAAKALYNQMDFAEKDSEEYKELQKKYQNVIGMLMEKVITVQPNLFDKKMIVFIINRDEVHWEAVYVFNPSYIQSDVSTDPNALRCCFFRYCGKHNDGWTYIHGHHGIPWFLNLLYNYHHSKVEVASSPNAGVGTKTMVYLDNETPFGENYTGPLIGSKAFPSLKISTINFLPKQPDDYNCGMALIATTGIFLRDFFGDDVKIQRFKTTFSLITRTNAAEEMLIEDKTFVSEKSFFLPHIMFQPVEEQTLPNYLDELKRDLYRFFDRIAELDYFILPRRLDSKAVLLPEYEACRQQLRWPNKLLEVKTAPKTAPKQSPSDDFRRAEAAVSLTSLIGAMGGKENGNNDDINDLPGNNDDINDLPALIETEQQNDVSQEIEDNATHTSNEEEQQNVHKDVESTNQTLTSMKRKRNRERPMTRRLLQKKLQRSQSTDGSDSEESLTLKEIRKIRKLNKVPKQPPGEDETPKPKKKESILKRSKDDLLEKCMKMHLSQDGQVPCPADNEVLDRRSQRNLDSFIDNSFKKWEWHTKEEHLNWVRSQNKLIQEATKESTKQKIKLLIQHAVKERRQVIQYFTNQFKFYNTANIKGLAYNATLNKYYARVQAYYEPSEDSSDDEINEENGEYFKDIELPVEWVETQYKEDFITEVKQRAKDEQGYFTTPNNVEITYLHATITKVKYVRKHTKEVTDVVAMMKMAEEEKKKKKKVSKMVQDLSIQIHQKGQQRLETPKKTVVINAHWLGKTANSDRDKIPLEEKWVRDAFGDEFANALMASTKAFMEVPVGDYKKSHLVNHSILIVPGAPKIKFQQEEGMDVCVPNALASVLFDLGFYEQATQIYEFGLANMINGPVAGALDKVGQLAQKILPRWIQVSKSSINSPNAILKFDNLDQRTILLAVLAASDGHRSHAVAIHGGFVYDANEEIALPLCQEALDYCTSSATRKSRFLHFHRTLLFKYDGTKKSRITMMTRRFDKNTK